MGCFDKVSVENFVFDCDEKTTVFYNEISTQTSVTTHGKMNYKQMFRLEWEITSGTSFDSQQQLVNS